MSIQNNSQITADFDDSFSIDLTRDSWITYGSQNQIIGTGAIGDIELSKAIATQLSPGIRALKGDVEIDNGDILINGHSLKDFIHNVSERLNILQINPKLESEWEELRALGEQYRSLEQQILEKIAIWERLKA